MVATIFVRRIIGALSSRSPPASRRGRSGPRSRPHARAMHGRRCPTRRPDRPAAPSSTLAVAVARRRTSRRAAGRRPGSPRSTRPTPWTDVPAAGLRRARRRAGRLAPTGGAGPLAVPHRRRPHRLPEPAHQAAPRQPAAPAGASSASRSTAACCSTAGSTATSASPAGSSLADGTTDARRTSPSRSPGCRSWPSTSTATSTSAALVLDKPAAPDARCGAPASPAGELRATGSPSGPGDRRRRRRGSSCLFDVQPAAVLGADRSLLASGRLDNQVSCWAATDGARRRRSRPTTSP